MAFVTERVLCEIIHWILMLIVAS